MKLNDLLISNELAVFFHLSITPMPGLLKVGSSVFVFRGWLVIINNGLIKKKYVLDLNCERIVYNLT
jgi:hypothetical protein